MVVKAIGGIRTSSVFYDGGSVWRFNLYAVKKPCPVTAGAIDIIARTFSSLPCEAGSCQRQSFLLL